MDRKTIGRYSRQLVMSEMGVEGQRRLLNSSILVIGAGGLGSVVCLYLAGAGVKKLGICDGDTVELNNLHRQIAHHENCIGINKASSAADVCRERNSSINIVSYSNHLTTNNVLELFHEYDCIVDATDNVETRYLINDVCILLKKPFVSGSAVGIEGQVTVFNVQHNTNNNSSSVSDKPCYRCLYPEHQPYGQKCSDRGVIGPTVGIIGSWEALEAIKLMSGMGEVLHGVLCMFDGYDSTIHKIKLTNKNKECVICGDDPSITLDNFKDNDYYIPFVCNNNNKKKNDDYTNDDDNNIESVSVEEYKIIYDKNERHILIDVRVPVQYNICQFSNSINIPNMDIITETKEKLQYIANIINNNTIKDEEIMIYTICRRGVDSVTSQIALTKYIKDDLYEFSSKMLHCKVVKVINITNGMNEWVKMVDDTFPMY